MKTIMERWRYECEDSGTLSHTQVDDRLNDEEMMSLAVEGARALDKREA